MNPKDRAKWRIAQDAARLIAQEGIHDWNLARNKAAARLGLKADSGTPGNDEIEAALQEYYRLYRFDVQPQHIARLRQLALEAMRFFRQFSPRLVGGVFDGSAGAHSPITIYLFPDTPEDVMQNLMEARIPFEEISACITADGSGSTPVPGIGFVVDDVRVELCLLPAALKGQTVGRKDKSRPAGSIKDVEMLLR